MLLRYGAILRRKSRPIVLTPPLRGSATLHVAAFETSGSIEKLSLKYVALQYRLTIGLSDDQAS